MVLQLQLIAIPRAKLRFAIVGLKEIQEQDKEADLGWNDPIAYFSYLGANPNGKDHVSLLGENKFGFEDWYGGGDMDHDDISFEVDLTVS
ncbi:DUF4114 domain-containing protein [Coleofasciculus sp. E1-EBD-02]|uniref:DUF4114 domain-containing protein n=1 Tax=Coleofasciculus sp. E1-EBD-02 TaxID=3068481 RepID=UPI0040642340